MSESTAFWEQLNKIKIVGKWIEGLSNSKNSNASLGGNRKWLTRIVSQQFSFLEVIQIIQFTPGKIEGNLKNMRLLTNKSCEREAFRKFQKTELETGSFWYMKLTC